MIVNKYRFSNTTNNKFINIPIEVNTEDLGIGDMLSEYENDIVEKVINPIEDFEIFKFSHKERSDETSDINYEFNFFDYEISLENADINNYSTRFINFSNREVYYNSNSFKNSFFKLDFYDTKEIETQKILFTIILPTNTGDTVVRNITNQIVPKNVNIQIPSYKLDYIGNKEGFFIYWLRNENYLENNKFYMSCKFFDAKEGNFIRMINEPQVNLASPYAIDKSEKYFYEVKLDYTDKTYEVYKDLTRIGSEINKIKFFEYVNEQI